MRILKFFCGISSSFSYLEEMMFVVHPVDEERGFHKSFPSRQSASVLQACPAALKRTSVAPPSY